MTHLGTARHLSTPFARRDFLRAVAFVAGGAVLAGCGSPVAAGLTGSQLAAGTVDYWNLFGGGDGARMQQMQEVFRKENPQLALRAAVFAWGNPYYTKLSLATLGDQPPDVAVAHLTRMRTLVDADLLQPLAPDDLGRHGMTPDRFSRTAWENCQINGQTYAIPLDTHPFVLFYNTEIAEKAGLLDGSGALLPMDGPDAFLDALRRAKDASGGDYGGVISINNDTATNWRIFQTLYAQLGGEVVADNGRKVVLDDAKAGQALEYLRTLTVGEQLMPAAVDYAGAIALFASGKVGFYAQGEWEITSFQTAKTPFSMTLFPNVLGGDRYAVQADSHTFVLPRWAAGDRDRLDRALVFVRSMLDQSLTWAKGGHIPSWLPTRDSDKYRALTPQSNYAAAADAAVYDPPGWYSGSGSNFENVVGSAVAAVRAGQQSPQVAIEQIRTGLQQFADTPAPI
jgi:multiple sugar transport system substrate-binding protein